MSTTVIVLVVGVVLVVLLTWHVAGVPEPAVRGWHVFRASRLSRGNRLFPTQVAVTPTSVVHYTPYWFGAHEHSIHLAHIASVRVDSRILFSDVLIETTGGDGGIRCTGHRKRDAARLKALIEERQSGFYRPEAQPPWPEPAGAPVAKFVSGRANPERRACVRLPPCCAARRKQRNPTRLGGPDRRWQKGCSVAGKLWIRSGRPAPADRRLRALTECPLA